MTHTPTPWEIQQPMDHEIWIVETGKQSYEWRVIAGCPLPEDRNDIPRRQVEANATLIVRAVNSHDALVETLTEIMDALDAWRGNGTYPDFRTWEAKARAIFAKVQS